MKLNELLPVAISMVVIILVALIQRQSKAVAAVTATMPVTIPLTLWIVYSASKGDRQAVEQFTGGMMSGIFPTVVFVAAIWIGARLGVKLLPLISLGYLAWGITLGALLLLRRFSG